MKIRDLYEDGRIVKGVNTTPDVDTNSISKEAAKFGSKVDKDGRPPVINSKAAKNSTPNKLANLGLAESRFTPMEMAIMEGGHSLEDYVTESDLLVQQYSTPSLLKFLKKLSDLPVDMLLKKAIYKELKKRGVKTESLQEIKTINFDKGNVDKTDFDEFIGDTKPVTKIKGYEIHFATSENGDVHHYLVKDPNGEGFLGELKLHGFRRKYWTSMVFFAPEIQGKGIGLPLYAYVIKKGYTVVSDSSQTAGSREGIWKKLNAVPGIFVYAWDKRYDDFYQWDPDEDLDSEVYRDEEKIAQLDQDYDDGKISPEDYKKAHDELSQVMKFSDVRLVAIANKKNVKENLDEITRRNLLKGIGVAGAGAATGAKVDVAKAATSASGKFDPKTLQPGEKYWKVVISAPKYGQIVKYHRIDSFKDVQEVYKVYKDLVAKYDLGSHDLDAYRMTRGGKTNENFADGKKFVEPNFDVEWGEAARYPEFQKIGKEAWIELAKKGKEFTIKSAKGINNTDAADPNSFKTLDPTKQKRALAQLEKGSVEMPIVAVYSDGYKELVGGNTRLTAMMAKDGKATIWAFKVPDEVAELAENFADGKEKGPSKPGRFKKAGVSCKGSVTSLRKKAKNASGERQKGYHFCANMKSGRKKG